jgi:2-hydroxychromene-2-carboxylate isomerase
VVDIDLYWSFRSPYSYLATPAAMALQAKYDIGIHLRPVLPIAVRDPSFFSPENARRGRYIQVDWPRRARMKGMSSAWPSPDPIVQDLATFKIADEQPYIHRLTHLGVEAERRGAGLPFAKEASHLIFGGVKNWDEGDHLGQAAARSGMDLEAMDRAVGDAAATHSEEVEANQDALQAAGHWGVPTFVYNGEPFFGEDRIDTLEWCLQSDDVARR